MANGYLQNEVNRAAAGQQDFYNYPLWDNQREEIKGRSRAEGKSKVTVTKWETMGGDGDGRRETGSGGLYPMMGAGERRPETGGGGGEGRGGDQRWWWEGAEMEMGWGGVAAGVGAAAVGGRRRW